jgi:hypothetical protein
MVWYACDLDRTYCLHLSFSLLLMVCFLGILNFEFLVHMQCSVKYLLFCGNFTISEFLFAFIYIYISIYEGDFNFKWFQAFHV